MLGSMFTSVKRVSVHYPLSNIAEILVLSTGKNDNTYQQYDILFETHPSTISNNTSSRKFSSGQLHIKETNYVHSSLMLSYSFNSLLILGTTDIQWLWLLPMGQSGASKWKRLMASFCFPLMHKMSFSWQDKATAKFCQEVIPLIEF